MGQFFNDILESEISEQDFSHKLILLYKYLQCSLKILYTFCYGRRALKTEDLQHGKLETSVSHNKKEYTLVRSARCW